MKKEEVLKQIAYDFDKQWAMNGQNFFKGIKAKVTYIGFETRIRFDEASGLYWGRMDNEDKSIVFGEKKIEKAIKRFIKNVEAIIDEKAKEHK